MTGRLFQTSFRLWMHSMSVDFVKRAIFLFPMTLFSAMSRIKLANLKRNAPPMLAISFGLKTRVDPREEEKKLLLKADQLFEQNKLNELMPLLQSVDSRNDNSEILWRVARCQYHFLKYRGDRGSSDYSQMMQKSLDMVTRAIELDPTCGPAYKWSAIILDEFSSVHGVKARISQLLNVRDYMEKAIQYSPQDPTSYYLLGEWHYSCCSVSWVEKNIAKVLFGKLPEDASYEKALELFSKAEELQPDFYSKNKLMLAKTLLALGKDNELAFHFLKEIITKYQDSKKWDDQEAINQAMEILKKHSIKFSSE